ncbi:coiled-coil domain-containing protein 50 isoform X2 [Ahaetulla prasina]|uniref:coiled-coil domain-containing protein 50 isoform X2 n=1 Tax=Ahaetulla prasina TaxID=499056 RepID=UPI002647A04B|nr:coiled-coil domain-containing protein 50 isoform X2 [Ahaetulla prasina]
MAEVGIDRSKLPGVKEVCRDFAVREDHTLAHNLQEQEIEHHLATNIQRNRLVKHDLQMAKQLQEEEDRKARARLQEQHKNLEQQDCEIAQEIQVKLVIEAEEQRRQEEDDEDIARILQQKELQEEKKRKKLPPDPLRLAAPEEAPCPENRGTKPRGSKEDAYARPRVGASRDPEAYDAEIAWKLQEEELLASQVDRRAAQVAQDEEIARLLMAEEKKAYKKAKEREKRRQDQDLKDPPESACGRSREGYDPHRGRSEKPTRAAPPSTQELEPPPGLPSQPHVAHQGSAHKDTDFPCSRLYCISSKRYPDVPPFSKETILSSRTMSTNRASSSSSFSLL